MEWGNLLLLLQEEKIWSSPAEAAQPVPAIPRAAESGTAHHMYTRRLSGVHRCDIWRDQWVHGGARQQRRWLSDLHAGIRIQHGWRARHHGAAHGLWQLRRL